MIRKVISILCAFTIFMGAPSACMAEFFGDAPEGEVSVFSYGMRGLTLGMLCGLSGGYLRYKDEDDNTKDILMSVGYGSLVGSGVGLICGFTDLARGEKGYGAVILRDMHLGGGFGLLVGTIWGGVNAIKSEEWGDLGDGVAWGYLGGALLGLGIGIIEAPKVVAYNPNNNVRYKIALRRDSKNNTFPVIKATVPF